MATPCLTDENAEFRIIAHTTCRLFNFYKSLKEDFLKSNVQKSTLLISVIGIDFYV